MRYFTFGRVAGSVVLLALLSGMVVLMVWIGQEAVSDRARTASTVATVVDSNRCTYWYTFEAEGRTYENSSRHLKSVGKTQACTSRARAEVASFDTVAVRYDPSNAVNNSPKHAPVGLYVFLEVLTAVCLVPIAGLLYYTLTD